MPDVSFRYSDVGYRPPCSDTIDCAAELIRAHSGRVSVISGAGLSAHALPTFRSNNNTGLWEVLNKPILAHSHFLADVLPAWKLSSNVRSLQLRGALKPSLSHKIIHEMIQREMVAWVVTQNVDGLHNFPGDESHIVELHGSVGDFGKCENCGRTRKVDAMKILQELKPPRCEVCGFVLKPPVAFFHDAIPKELRVAADQALNRTEVLILVGTHCVVDPVLSLVEEAKRRGVVVIEVNPEATLVSRSVDVVLRDTADEAFKAIAAILMPDLDLSAM